MPNESTRYGPKQPPENIDAALDRIAEVTCQVTDIHAQLADAKALLEDRDVPWGNPKKKEALRWKPRATRAKAHMEMELTFLKNWVRKERVRLNAELLSNRINPHDPRGLLMEALRVLRKIKGEGVDLNQREDALLRTIEAHLGFG